MLGPPLGTSFGVLPVQVSISMTCGPYFLVGFFRDGGFMSGSLLIGSYFSMNKGAH